VCLSLNILANNYGHILLKFEELVSRGTGNSQLSQIWDLQLSVDFWAYLNQLMMCM